MRHAEPTQTTHASITIIGIHGWSFFDQFSDYKDTTLRLISGNIKREPTFDFQQAI